MIVIGIAAGVTFVTGFGIGVQLYETTNKSPSSESQSNLSQIEIKNPYQM